MMYISLALKVRYILWILYIYIYLIQHRDQRWASLSPPSRSNTALSWDINSHSKVGCLPLFLQGGLCGQHIITRLMKSWWGL